MTSRTQNLSSLAILCSCGVALTGWTGAPPSGLGTVVLVSLGLFGLAFFPHTTTSSDAREHAAQDQAETDSTTAS